MMEIRASDKPYRPFAVKMINTIGSAAAKIGFEPISLNPQKLIDAAIKKAGCHDFGPETYREGLEVFTHSLESEAQLNTLGRAIARATIVDSLVNRLQMIDWRKKHPEVADQEIRKPLVIAGLPRTGTTILHALLDVDPANRSPLFWEVAYPVPPAAPATWKTDPRIKKDQDTLDNLSKLCPGFDAVHPMGALMPQECVSIFGWDMQASSFHATFNVPSYIEWLDKQKLESTFQIHKQALQHFQSGGVTGERWLLKSPAHLHLLDTLLTTYPDANIIHTHRNPVDVCVSIASLMSMLRGISTDNIDRQYIGKQQLVWWKKLLDISLAQRKDLGADHPQFFDIRFNEVNQDPLGAIERLYQHFGYELKSNVKKDMERYIREHSRDKHGSHTYSATDFGIDRERDRALFQDYCDYFGV